MGGTGTGFLNGSVYERHRQVDTYQAAGPGDIQVSADGVGGGGGPPVALWHLDTVEVEEDLDLLCWVEECVAGEGDAVDALISRQVKTPAPRSSCPSATPGRSPVLKLVRKES